MYILFHSYYFPLLYITGGFPVGLVEYKSFQIDKEEDGGQAKGSLSKMYLYSLQVLTPPLPDAFLLSLCRRIFGILQIIHKVKYGFNFI